MMRWPGRVSYVREGEARMRQVMRWQGFDKIECGIHVPEGQTTIDAARAAVGD